jgi:hypothetical protein
MTAYLQAKIAEADRLATQTGRAHYVIEGYDDWDQMILEVVEVTDNPTLDMVAALEGNAFYVAHPNDGR